MDLDEQIRLNITEESLSPKFENLIVENGDQIIIRSNLKSMEDINEWVKELGIRTDTKWNSKKSRPKGERFICWHNITTQHVPEYLAKNYGKINRIIIWWKIQSKMQQRSTISS
ncbi:unnamed protein product [Larinioides sclopetarius]|uniref:Uncharacterized protein n=1 Tax=Larinioides sclopetarius TaxID=280406 RepID=A0AAV1YTY8_9ARAC